MTRPLKWSAKLTATVLSLCLILEFCVSAALLTRSNAVNSAVPAAAVSAVHAEQTAFGDWLTKDASGFFTFLLVLVGIGQAALFFWQLHYMRESIRDTKVLALAAQASAETAKEQVAMTRIGIFDLERAYLAVGPTKIRLDFIRVPGKQVSRPGDPLETILTLHVHNTGRTAAIITKVYGEFSRQPPTSPKPIYRNGFSFITDLSVAAGAESDLTPVDFRDPFDGNQFFWGYIEYADIFGNIRTSRFCAAIFPSTTGPGKFQLAGSDPWRLGT